jgi:pyrroloquinoline-quinone synthase
MTSAFIGRLDSLIASKHLLTHPFYQEWQRGELSIPALQDYATQYYQHVAAFPTYLSALHSCCDDLETRRHLLQNLIDEEAGSPNHQDLWLQFAGAIGLSIAQVKNATAGVEVSQLIRGFREICGSGKIASSLAALYAYESQIPTVSVSKTEGLIKHYGVAKGPGTAYFDVHAEMDIEHSRIERELLERHLDSEDHEAIATNVWRVLDRLWELLSGVCQRHSIA